MIIKKNILKFEKCNLVKRLISPTLKFYNRINLIVTVLGEKIIKPDCSEKRKKVWKVKKEKLN